jgi:hypothetical protein
VIPIRAMRRIPPAGGISSSVCIRIAMSRIGDRQILPGVW